MVILQGENIRRKTYADNQGNFTFDHLPYGKYSVTTCAAGRAGVYPNTKMTATESKLITVKDRHPQHVIFTPDIFHVDLYGKVVNQAKQPVANAKVTATWIYPQTFLEQGNVPTWETVTDENGNFELKGIPPSNWLLIASALLSKQRSYDGIEIKITTAEGARSTPVKLPLISEDILYFARRFSAVLRNIYKPAEIKCPQDDNFIKSLPKSERNNIYIGDIVADR